MFRIYFLKIAINLIRKSCPGRPQSPQTTPLGILFTAGSYGPSPQQWQHISPQKYNEKRNLTSLQINSVLWLKKHLPSFPFFASVKKREKLAIFFAKGIARFLMHAVRLDHTLTHTCHDHVRKFKVHQVLQQQARKKHSACIPIDFRGPTFLADNQS